MAKRLSDKRLQEIAEFRHGSELYDSAKAARELIQQRALEKAIRVLDHLGHRDSCNTYMGWGPDCPCDCPAADVKAALAALEEIDP